MNSDGKERKWWMFLPLILCLGAIFYYAEKEAEKPKPKYIVQEMDSEREILRSVPERDVYPDDPAAIIKNSILWRKDCMLELLSLRLWSAEEREAILAPLLPENDELLIAEPAFSDQELALAQEKWMKSGNVTLAVQKQMLMEDEVMQYAALELLIRRKIAELPAVSSDKDKQLLWHLLRVQSALVIREKR